MIIFEILGLLLELIGTICLRYPEPPPSLPVRPDNWTAPDAADIARVLGGVPSPGNDSPDEKADLSGSQPGGGGTESPLSPSTINSFWDRELDG
jgi:hypothetical protein